MWGGDGARSVAIPTHMRDTSDVQLLSLTGEWDAGLPAGHHPYMDGAIDPLLAMLMTAVLLGGEPQNDGALLPSLGSALIVLPSL